MADAEENQQLRRELDRLSRECVLADEQFYDLLKITRELEADVERLKGVENG